MKKVLFTMALLALAMNVSAQEKTTIEVPQWVKNVKFSGYGMLQYQGQDPEGNHTNTFNLRLARFILDGKIGDFDWRAQIQGTNVKGPGEPTVNILSLRFVQDSSNVLSPMKILHTLSHRAGIPMLMSSMHCLASATVLEKNPAAVVTSVYRLLVTSSPMLMVVTCSTIR